MAETKNNNNNNIEITLEYGTWEFTWETLEKRPVKVKENELVKELKKKAADKFKVKPYQIIFYRGGEFIDDTNTIDSLKIKDGHTVRVNIRKPKTTAVTAVRTPKERAAAAIYQEQLQRFEEFASLGNLMKSSDPVELTESEADLVVKCIKHTFMGHIVLQFDMTNKLNDKILEDVTVQVEPADAFKVVAYVPCPTLKYNEPGISYACVAISNDEEDPTDVTTTISCSMKFTVKDCDPNTGEAYHDGFYDGHSGEFVLKDVEITVADHEQKVIKSNFGATWEELGEENELERKKRTEGEENKPSLMFLHYK